MGQAREPKKSITFLVRHEDRPDSVVPVRIYQHQEPIHLETLVWSIRQAFIDFGEPDIYFNEDKIRIDWRGLVTGNHSIIRNTPLTAPTDIVTWLKVLQHDGSASCLTVLAPRSRSNSSELEEASPAGGE